MKLRKLGRFKISGQWLLSYSDSEIAEASKLFDGMIVLEAKSSLASGKFEYVAAGEMFDIVQHGEEIPEYVATFESGSIIPKWIKMQ